MKKYFSFLSLAVAGLLVMGTGCVNQSADTNSAVNPANQNVPAETDAINAVTTEDNATDDSVTAAEGMVMVELTTTGTDTAYDQSFEVNAESTVLEVMEAAAVDYGFEYTTQTAEGLGEYVDSVGGVIASGDTGYWLYYINSEAAFEGIATQIVQDGDVIEWRFESAL